MSATHSTYPRPTAERLAHLYTVLQLGCPDIGWLYERDASTVRHWLLKAGIPTRGRGMNAAQWLKPGDPRSFAGTKHTDATRARISASSKGRKPYLRDGQHWLKTVPADQNPNWKGGATPERQEFYRSDEWKEAVKAVWQRDDACCQRCSLDWRTVDRDTTPTFHVHHRVSFAVRELRAVVSNLVLLCRPCHLWVHSNANTAFDFLEAEEPNKEVSHDPAIA